MNTFIGLVCPKNVLSRFFFFFCGRSEPDLGIILANVTKTSENYNKRHLPAVCDKIDKFFLSILSTMKKEFLECFQQIGNSFLAWGVSFDI